MRCTHCSNEVKPIVCLDIDGTMANYHGHFLQFAADYFGAADESWALTYGGVAPLHEFMGVSLHEYRLCKLAFRQGGMKRSMPVYGYASQLTRDLRLSGIELWITTTRPYLRMDNIDPDTREWLSRNEIQYDHLFYDEDKYDNLCEMVDKERILCVVDDEPEQITLANMLGLATIWRRTVYNSCSVPPVLTQPGAVHCHVHRLAEVTNIVSNLQVAWTRRYE